MRVLLAGLAGLLVASLLVGAAGAGVPDWLILWQIRLPRTLLAALVGAGLGLSGAVLQGALRNPLADPGLLGIGGCAALGAVLAYYWGISARFPPALPAGALLGATAGCALLVGFAGPALSGPSLILAGIALSAAASAFLALALSLAPNPFALSDITFWLMGGLEDRTMTHLALAAPVILAGVLVLLRLGARLDALSLGEATAATLGVPVRRTLLLASVGVTLAVGGGGRRGGRGGGGGGGRGPAGSALSGWWCRICCGRCSASGRAVCWRRLPWGVRRCCWRRTCWRGWCRCCCRCPASQGWGC
jgi:iron complex transport system permease protein